MQFIHVLVTVLFFVLIAAAAYTDARREKIPNRLAAAIALLAAASFWLFPGPAIWERGAGLLCVSLPMLLLSCVIPGAFGGGDIKLMAAAGLFLGWKRCLLAFLTAILVAGVYGCGLLLLKKAKRKTRIVLGPFFALGIMVAFLSVS